MDSGTIFYFVILASMNYNGTSCPKTEIIIKDKSEWVQRDQNCLESATKRCVVHYPNSPCLIKFEKMEEGRYRAYCGAKR